MGLLAVMRKGKSNSLNTHWQKSKAHQMPFLIKEIDKGPTKNSLIKPMTRKRSENNSAKGFY